MIVCGSMQANAVPNQIRAVQISTIDRVNFPPGRVWTVAGSGSPSFADGLGHAASFYRPIDVQMDPGGTQAFVVRLVVLNGLGVMVELLV